VIVQPVPRRTANVLGIAMVVLNQGEVAYISMWYAESVDEPSDLLDLLPRLTAQSADGFSPEGRM
jgi:hypothetical protein